MKKYQVVVKDVTDGADTVVQDYTVEIPSEKVADALKFGLWPDTLEVQAQIEASDSSRPAADISNNG